MFILLVEDNPSEAWLTREALKETGLQHDLQVVTDGEKATRFLRREGEFSEAPVPQVVLLDLNLPRKNGRDVLRDIKADPALRQIPVIVISNSSSPDDINAVYGLNGNCYLVKPHEVDELFSLIRSMADFWLRKAALPDGTALGIKAAAA